jgi:hypothetical protein
MANEQFPQLYAEYGFRAVLRKSVNETIRYSGPTLIRVHGIDKIIGCIGNFARACGQL